jgi:hypothetical protein
MTRERSTYQLHLFLLRLWRERLGQDRFEWRGAVKNTSTGEVRYFRNGITLFDALCVMVDDAKPSPEEDRGGATDPSDRA